MRDNTEMQACNFHPRYNFSLYLIQGQFELYNYKAFTQSCLILVSQTCQSVMHVATILSSNLTPLINS